MRTYTVEHDGEAFTWHGAGPRIVAAEVVRAKGVPDGETLTVIDTRGHPRTFESIGTTARPVGFANDRGSA